MTTITNLKQLLQHVSVSRTVSPVAIDSVKVTGIASDSRRVIPGSIFVAVKGTQVDGETFIPAAIEAGATVIVCRSIPENPDSGIIWVESPDTAEALGILASAYNGYPSEQLQLIGVTGTNGKTTIATLLYETARLRGLKAGLLSTVVNRIDDVAVEATHTTPDPIELNALLARMVEAGCTFAAMEVSSHAAAQRRIAGLKFKGGIFTNLTRDHLDYHKTFQAYLNAKKSFFDSLGKDSWALVNIDDRNGMVMVQNTKAKVYTYSVRTEADFTGKLVENRLDGMLIELQGNPVETLFSGRFNAQNLTAVYGAGVLSGVSPQDMLLIISSLIPVAGRFQCFRAGGVTGIVDYAHTPDALVNVLSTVRDILADNPSTAGRIITVFGAGGDRDKGKRPIMGAEAKKLSDILIVTSDNPRTENPDDIIRDILAGIPACADGKVITISDRESAIKHAVALARPGDVIVIAGKGHENYQIIGHIKHHFDDREVLCNALGLDFKN